MGIALKRGKDHIRSPDPDYFDKLRAVRAAWEAARASGGAVVFLFLDEMSYYRQPTLAAAYEATGAAQPLARRSHGADTRTRVAGALDPASGRVVWRQGSRCGVAELARFYRQVREAYPDAERIYVAQDNWPVHYHPDLLVALEPQETRWPIRTPPNWPTCPSAAARRERGGWGLPIQIVPLPTYAPWTNPIEKLWRWARQEVGHLHRLSDRLEELRQRFGGFLDRFAQGGADGSDLLRYVGLAGLERLYGNAF